jgi:alkylation response protein AidB-like acyl-CoA dehydrogenase
MGSFYDDNDDLRWYLERGIDWEPVVRLTEYDWSAADGPEDVAEAVEMYRDILSLIGTVVADEIAPRWRELDQAHSVLKDGEVTTAPVVDEVFSQLAELGFFGLSVPRELGGMNAPLLVFQLAAELLARADTSVCAHAGFHGGIALAALSYSIREGSVEFELDPPRITGTPYMELISEIVAGEAWGSMDITEPGAGSDMAAMRTRGEQLPDGSWVVTGQKIFITSGHGRWHIVIARTEEAEGLGAMSLFVVPAWQEVDGRRVRTVSVDGVEHKLGHTASTTCTVSFDRSPARLIGKRGEGFKQMLLLMNNARIGVGFECLGVAEAAWRAARAYAAERPSMGKTIDQHEMIAQMLEDMQTDIQAIRAMGVTACWHEELAQKANIALTFLPLDDARRAELERDLRRHQRSSRRLTPLLKWYASEACVDIARKSIQIHGGSGYITETGVEKLLRDAMVFPIYEGTSQIQSLMVMKDTLMGVVKAPRRFLQQLTAARWRSLSARDPMEKRVAALQLTSLKAVQFLLTRLASAKARELPILDPGQWASVMADWDPKRDFALAMLHAERLTAILHDVAVAELLLEQARRDPAREELLIRWLERVECRCRFRYDEITTTGLRLLGRLSEARAEPLAAR